MVEMRLVNPGKADTVISFSEITDEEKLLLRTPAGDTKVKLRMADEAMRGHAESMLFWVAFHVGSYLAKIKMELNPEKSTKRVYVMRTADGRFKIGISKDIKTRMAALRTGAGVEVASVVSCPGTRDDERRLILGLGAHRIAGEWFCDAPLLHAVTRWIETNKRVPSTKELLALCERVRDE